MKFRKRPVVVDAHLWTGANFVDIEKFLGSASRMHYARSNHALAQLVIHTLEGDMRAMPGDWIIKGVSGEFYPCKPEIFEATYEPAE